MVKAGGIAKPDGVGGGEQPEPGVRPDDAVLVEQCQLAFDFEHALDDEHDIGPAGVIFVENQRGRGLQRPGQQAFTEFGDLLALAQHDRVLADQIDAADVAVEVDAHARPVEAGGDLLDMRGFSRTVIALHQDTTVVGEAGENRQRGVGIEYITGIDIGHAFIAVRKSRHMHVDIDAEYCPGIDGGVGRPGRGQQGVGKVGWVSGHGGQVSVRKKTADFRCV